MGHDDRCGLDVAIKVKGAKKIKIWPRLTFKVWSRCDMPGDQEDHDMAEAYLKLCDQSVIQMRYARGPRRSRYGRGLPPPHLTDPDDQDMAEAYPVDQAMAEAYPTYLFGTCLRQRKAAPHFLI